jgi:hypothetical protein
MAPPLSGSCPCLNHFYVLGLRAPVRRLDLELDPLPLLQTPESSGLDRRVMDEEITTPVLLYEAKPFFLVEPLDGSLRHRAPSCKKILDGREQTL